MENEFIPYELALELKELEFDEPCFGEYRQWDGNEPWLQLYQDLDGCSTDAADYEYTSEAKAPTFSQAFRFFREKYHIIGEVKYKGGKTTKTAWYDYVIYSEIDWNDENPNEQWKKHEEAELECLKKLIEIVKEK